MLVAATVDLGRRVSRKKSERAGGVEEGKNGAQTWGSGALLPFSLAPCQTDGSLQSPPPGTLLFPFSHFALQFLKLIY